MVVEVDILVWVKTRPMLSISTMLRWMAVCPLTRMSAVGGSALRKVCEHS